LSAHDDLITAARSLRDQGLTAYSIADLLATARRYGSTYPDPVLKKTLTTMIANTDDAAQDRDVFVEIRKGWYRLRR
jgi:orotate phosphoribosyltransferase-like protein